jgi:hypothetical protein
VNLTEQVRQAFRAEAAQWIPEVVAPSGEYGFVRRRDKRTGRPSVRVVHRKAEPEPHWSPTPADYYATEVVNLDRRLAIDLGTGWHLPLEDSLALAEFARTVAEQDDAWGQGRNPLGCCADRTMHGGPGCRWPGPAVPFRIV